MTSWTDRIDLENEIIRLEPGEGSDVSFTAWWDHLVGMAVRLIDLQAAEKELNKRQGEYNPAHDPRKPKVFQSPAEFFAYHKLIAERRACQQQAYQDWVEVTQQIGDLAVQIGGQLADSSAAFFIRLDGREYVLRYGRSGYGNRDVSIMPVPQEHVEAGAIAS